MNQIIRAEYLGDSGNSYTVGINSEVAALLGGDPAVSPIGYTDAGTVGMDPLPRQMKPRRVTVVNPAGIARQVICLSPTAPLWTGSQTTIQLEDSDGNATVYTVQKRHAESARKRRKTAAV